MEYRQIFATVNAETGKFCDADDPTATLRNDFLPRVMLTETVVFCLTFIDNAGAAYVFGASDTFAAGCDNDFNHTTDLIASAESSAFNNILDWDDADPTSGKICVRMAFSGTTASTKCGTSEMVYPYLQINRYKAGSAVPSMPCVGKFTLVNVPMTTEGAPADPDPVYYTAAQVDALLAAYLKKALVGRVNSHEYELDVDDKNISSPEIGLKEHA